MIEDRPTVALAHDWLVGLRGGERVLDRLAARYGPCDLYTLVHDGRPLTPAIDACRIVTSPLQHWPGARGRWRRHYLPFMPWAVERLEVQPCDVVVSTSSAVMKSIRPPTDTPHVCYCHSPARYLWEQTDDYAIGAGGIGRRLGLRLIGRRFRDWDRRTADRVTTFVANSAHTAARIKRCYQRDAVVVHPPVRTTYFTPDDRPRASWLLVVAALEPYKRTDLVVEAARQGGFPLKVVGTGSQAEALAKDAPPGVELLGAVDDETLRELYRTAKALVFPQVEDFGIVAVEAQAAGCPVIAFDGGAARETVTPATGAYFKEQTVAAIVDAVRAFDASRHPPAACRAHAETFSERSFDVAMERVIAASCDEASSAAGPTLRR